MDDNRKLERQGVEPDIFSLAGDESGLLVIQDGVVTGALRSPTTEAGTPAREAAIADLRDDLAAGMNLGGLWWYVREDAYSRW